MAVLLVVVVQDKAHIFEGGHKILTKFPSFSLDVIMGPVTITSKQIWEIFQ